MRLLLAVLIAVVRLAWLAMATGLGPVVQALLEFALDIAPWIARNKPKTPGIE